MNLKESFRYQNFLSSMINEAGASLTAPSHCLTTTKNHLRNKVNDGAADMQETVDVGEFPANDSVLDFMLFLIGEREKLTTAIGTVTGPTAQNAVYWLFKQGCVKVHQVSGRKGEQIGMGPFRVTAFLPFLPGHFCLLHQSIIQMKAGCSIFLVYRL